MLIIPPAQSNADRQRRFRERNPGYYARIQATKRASAKRWREQFFAQLRAEHEATLAAMTPDVVTVTMTATPIEAATPATVEILAPTVEIVAPTMKLIPPAAAFGPPTFEVVADSADVFLRIFPSTSDALAA